jgi:hypothetical protein
VSAAESPQEAFARGVTAGEIAEQLRSHDDRLNKINGSIERTADALEVQAMALQRIADQMEADRKTVVVTAQALKDEGEARRNTAEVRWTPTARAISVMMALVALVGLGVTLYLATRP